MADVVGPALNTYNPIVRCDIKKDQYASTAINLQHDHILKILNMISSGNISYNGVFKLQYNKDENSLDVLYFEENDVILVMRISNTEISI